MDQRGYGDSDKPSGYKNYTSDHLTSDIKQLIPALGNIIFLSVCLCVFSCSPKGEYMYIVVVFVCLLQYCWYCNPETAKLQTTFKNYKNLIHG